MTVSFRAGQKLRASDLLDPPRGIIARGRRISSSTATAATSLSTGQGVQRLPASLEAGRLYRVSSPNVGIFSSVSGDRIGLGYTYTTDGSSPTAESTVLSFTQRDVSGIGVVHGVELEAHYVPAANQTFTVLLVVWRQGGTGNVQTYGAADWPCDIVITDIGVDTGDAGVDI